MADFFFKTTKFQAFLLSIPKSIRNISTLFLVTTISMLWFMGIYKPLGLYYQLNQTNYTSLHSMHDVNKKIKGKNKKIEKLLNQKNSILNNDRNNLPTEGKVSAEEYTSKKIADLFNRAHKALLTVNKHTPLEPTNSDWFLSFHSCNEFQGSFNALVTFLQNLSKSDLGTLVNSLTIAKHDEDSLILTLNLTINQIADSIKQNKDMEINEQK